MKKRWWILIIVVFVISLFVPIKRVYRDGGTVEYSTVLYKVIKWNRIRRNEENKTGTEIYWFPRNLHSLEYYDPPRPESIAICNGNEFVVANIGSYQWSKKVGGKTQYINAFAISPLDMEYKKTLQIVKGNDVKADLLTNVTQIKTYQYNGKEAEIIDNKLEYDQEKQTINVGVLEKGINIIELFVENGNNEVRYSFRIEIVEKI